MDVMTDDNMSMKRILVGGGRFDFMLSLTVFILSVCLSLRMMMCIMFISKSRVGMVVQS